MFEFDGLNLKKICRDDLDDLLVLKNETWKSTNRTTIATMEDQVRWFESLDQDVHCPRNLVLIARDCMRTKIGIFKIFGVDWVHRSAEVGWDVFKQHRGKGCGKYLVKAGSAFCFRILNLWRLNCEILEPNIASQKCAVFAGFQKEGIKRLSVFKDGQYFDSEIYGFLEADFRQNSMIQASNRV